MDKSISKKATLEERQKLYMGPEILIELRYAQVIIINIKKFKIF